MTLYAEVHPPAAYEASAQLNTSGSTNTTIQNSTTQPQPTQLPSCTAAGSTLHTLWTSSPPTSIPQVSAVAALSGLAWPTRAVHLEKTSPTSTQPESDLRGTVTPVPQHQESFSSQPSAPQECSRHVPSTETWTSAEQPSRLCRRDSASATPTPPRCITATAPAGITHRPVPNYNSANFSSSKSGPTGTLCNSAQLLDIIVLCCLHICSLWFCLCFFFFTH